MNPKPQKRHKALQRLSREHHHGLLLSWKIRTGLSKNISSDRIWDYANWFYNMHLIPHFEMEENHIFIILENDNSLVQQALMDHKDIELLFTECEKNERTLTEIEAKLEEHIRFEERKLFPEIQKVATELQYQTIEKLHSEDPFADKIDDEFWR